MKAVFIESTEFTRWVSQHLPDETYAELQHQLMENPQRGTVLRGCGGLRKVRTADPKRGMGKRSGARVIYLYVPEAKCFFMLDIYDKQEQENLTAAQRKELAQLAEEFKRQARGAFKRTSTKET